MSKYTVKNCPALRWDRKKFKVCYKGNKETKCCDIDDCIIKRIVELCGKHHVIDAGFQKAAINYLSSDILRLLEFEEADE